MTTASWRPLLRRGLLIRLRRAGRLVRPWRGRVVPLRGVRLLARDGLLFQAPHHKQHRCGDESGHQEKAKTDENQFPGRGTHAKRLNRISAPRKEQVFRAHFEPFGDAVDLVQPPHAVIAEQIGQGLLADPECLRRVGPAQAKPVQVPLDCPAHSLVELSHAGRISRIQARDVLRVTWVFAGSPLLVVLAGAVRVRLCLLDLVGGVAAALRVQFVLQRAQAGGGEPVGADVVDAPPGGVRVGRPALGS